MVYLAFMDGTKIFVFAFVGKSHFEFSRKSLVKISEKNENFGENVHGNLCAFEFLQKKYLLLC
jgi:hypothetical protein